MIKSNFVVFILTHNRPDNVLTYKAIIKSGYTGKIYFVVDNEDKHINKYIENYGKDNVLIFDKKKKSKEFDTMDLPEASRNAVVYARNACFDFAEQMGIKYFLELDDDYIEFRQRFIQNGVLKSRYVLDFDSCCEETIDFLEKSNALTIAWSQIGDFIGGANSELFKNKVKRKAMNSFFCKTSRRFDFIGRINEDVNTYVSLGSKGEIILTVCDLSLNQRATQQNEGGMTDLYMQEGTFTKSFYTIICSPSCVKIGVIGVNYFRYHHSIDWNYAVPKIIDCKYKK